MTSPGAAGDAKGGGPHGGGARVGALALARRIPAATWTSALRWALAGALTVVALGLAVQSTRTYVAHEMSLGSGAVIATAGLLLLGLVSLGAARWRLAGELGAVHASSPSAPTGHLATARLARLSALAAAGTRPDAAVLAEVSRAEEAGRAYVGRYLVATIVLVGLVGTFAGLMQTLGKLTPLFGDVPGGAGLPAGLAALAGPLAGLQVTFGASLVAILATLALSLVQGDLALCEERVLAALEDRTTHEWIPALWPPAAVEPWERVARALEAAEAERAATARELRDGIARGVVDLKRGFGESVSTALERSLGQLTAESRAESARTARAIEALSTAVGADTARLVAAVTEQMARLVADVTEQSGRVGTAVAAELEAGVGRHSRALAELATGQGAALSAATAGAAERWVAASHETLATMRAELARASARAERVAETVAGGVRSAIEEALARATAASEAASRLMTELSEGTNGRTAALLDAVGAGTAKAVHEMAAEAGRVVAEAALGSARAQEAVLRETSTAFVRAAGETREAFVRTADETREALAGASGALRTVGVEVGQTLTETAHGFARAQEGVLRQTGEAFVRAVEETRVLLARAAGETTTAVAETLQPLFAEQGRAHGDTETALRAVVSELAGASARVDALAGTLAEVGRQQAASLEQGSQAVLEAFDRAIIGGGSALEGAAQRLAGAAHELQQGAEVLGPRLASLTAELGALGREVALLTAARGPDDEVAVSMMSELDRLGVGMERLAALVEMAEATAAGEPAPVAPADDDAVLGGTPAPGSAFDDPAASAGRGGSIPAGEEEPSALADAGEGGSIDPESSGGGGVVASDADAPAAGDDTPAGHDPPDEAASPGGRVAGGRKKKNKREASPGGASAGVSESTPERGDESGADAVAEGAAASTGAGPISGESPP